LIVSPWWHDGDMPIRVYPRVGFDWPKTMTNELAGTVTGKKVIKKLGDWKLKT